MKRAWFGLSIGGIVLSMAVTGAAQLSPVKLTVTERARNDRVSSNAKVSTTQFTYYEVELQNVSAKSYSELAVKWTMVVQPPRNKPIKLLSGDHQVKLEQGKKVAVQTDAVETGIRTLKRGSKKIETTNTTKSEIVGYLIEVWEGDKMLATALEPADIRSTIEKLKNKDTKPAGEQQFHRL